MSFDPHFPSRLDPEVRAFIHIAGIELRPNLNGDLVPFIRHARIDWACWLPRPEYFGGHRSMDFWKEVAKQAWEEIAHLDQTLRENSSQELDKYRY